MWNVGISKTEVLKPQVLTAPFTDCTSMANEKDISYCHVSTNYFRIFRFSGVGCTDLSRSIKFCGTNLKIKIKISFSLNIQEFPVKTAARIAFHKFTYVFVFFVFSRLYLYPENSVLYMQ